MTAHHDPLARYFQGSGEQICSSFHCKKPLTLQEKLCGDKCQSCQQPGAIVGMPAFEAPDNIHYDKIINRFKIQSEIELYQAIQHPTPYVGRHILELQTKLKAL